jgi:hypothetical protein
MDDGPPGSIPRWRACSPPSRSPPGDSPGRPVRAEPTSHESQHLIDRPKDEPLNRQRVGGSERRYFFSPRASFSRSSRPQLCTRIASAPSPVGISVTNLPSGETS